jgi:hypothetical protein
MIGCMALFEVVGRRLERRDPMTFADLGLRERQDLQALLLDQISALGEDLKVIAQEYGNWEDARRRLDIMAVRPQDLGRSASPDGSWRPLLSAGGGRCTAGIRTGGMYR